MSDHPRRLLKAWKDTARVDVCRAASCRRTITFIQNAKTLKFVPFDDISPIVRESEIGTGRELWTLDLAKTHFASCKAAPQFKRRRR
jgi:hypothetical protein